MSYGAFTDKTHVPSEMEMLSSVGKALNHWQSLIDYITGNYKTSREFKFYGVNYGWALRFKKYGKALLALYPGKDCFTIQIILNKQQLDQAMQLDLDPELVETIQQTSMIVEGKWLYFKITPDIAQTFLQNIEELVKIRASIG